jgi:hypothetical protein
MGCCMSSPERATAVAMQMAVGRAVVIKDYPRNPYPTTERWHDVYNESWNAALYLLNIMYLIDAKKIFKAFWLIESDVQGRSPTDPIVKKGAAEPLISNSFNPYSPGSQLHKIYADSQDATKTLLKICGADKTKWVLKSFNLISSEV